jgi:hypothetical protein
MLAARTNILTTNSHVYTLWEKDPEHNHSTIRHFDGVRHGEVHSRRLPVNLDAMQAMTEARSLAVRAWQTEIDDFCYEELEKAFPELVGQEQYRSMGSISVDWGRKLENETREVPA